MVAAGHVSIDDGTLGCDYNHVAVQRHLAELPSAWSVVLEDDAVVADSFRSQLGMVLAAAPCDVVSLYLGRSRPPQYQRHIAQALSGADEAHWLVGSRLLHAVGYAIRTELLPSLASFISPLPADARISAWAADVSPIGYCLPSIVDHRDGPTVARHPDGHRRTPGRVAWNFGHRSEWRSTSVVLGC